MGKQSERNKAAWEFHAYDFWMQQGKPEALAAKIMEAPEQRLRHHGRHFREIQGVRIANICGSNGRIAVPLALLGSEVTVFDISEENRRYALELAAAAGVRIDYILGDFQEVGEGFENAFDIAYAEGGVLHYFAALDQFTAAAFRILKPGGRLLLSDFHPFRKINREGSAMMSVRQTEGDYFDSRIHRGDVAYKNLLENPNVEKEQFPDCELRFYTMAEIVNAVISAGFVLRELEEHPNFENRKLPGEFTILADKPK
ncbi:MAG: class I SAM-dependent methyltransferase [Oscillospiraceae bacterium]